MTASDSNFQVRVLDGLQAQGVGPRTAPAEGDGQHTVATHDAKTARPDLQRIAESMTQLAVDLPWSMQLTFNADVKHSVIVVRSLETGQVVRQIPSEEAVALQKFIEGGNPKGEPPLGLLLDTLT